MKKKGKFKLWNLPNSLTIVRIVGSVCIPFLLLFSADETGCFLALIIFCFCSITDFLDGYLARRLNQTSNLGKMLDPIADKLLVVLVLSSLVLVFGSTYGYQLGIPIVIIITREILVSGIREFFGSSEQKFSVMNLSKLKTGMQMIAIIFLLTSQLRSFENLNLLQFGVFFLWIAAGFALYTGLVYVYRAMVLLGEERK